MPQQEGFSGKKCNDCKTIGELENTELLNARCIKLVPVPPVMLQHGSSSPCPGARGTQARAVHGAGPRHCHQAAAHPQASPTLGPDLLSIFPTCLVGQHHHHSWPRAAPSCLHSASQQTDTSGRGGRVRDAEGQAAANPAAQQGDTKPHCQPQHPSSCPAPGVLMWTTALLRFIMGFVAITQRLWLHQQCTKVD